MKPSLLIAIFVSVFTLTGCNPVQSTSEADKAAAVFHDLYDDKEYEKIFEAAHSDFKASQSQANIVNFLRSVREKLGKVKSTSRNGWNINSVNMKTNVILTFETEFENGKGVETFTYRVNDGSALLLGWHVNSNALFMKQSKEEGEVSVEDPIKAQEVK